MQKKTCWNKESWTPFRAIIGLFRLPLMVIRGTEQQLTQQFDWKSFNFEAFVQQHPAKEEDQGPSKKKQKVVVEVASVTENDFLELFKSEQ